MRHPTSPDVATDQPDQPDREDTTVTSSPTPPQAPPSPGSITDVAGVRVGQVTRRGRGWLTGVTVVVPPPGTVAGVDVRGGGPGTHETDALDPTTLVPTADAVVLTGGSAYGLASAHGAQRWCEEHGRGFRVGPGPGEVVPIVPAAAIFDLGRGGDFSARPGEREGYEAAVAAASPAGLVVQRGGVGAGTGALVAGGRFAGGVGSASVRVRLAAGTGDGEAGPSGGAPAGAALAEDVEVVVGALAVVNARGAPTAPGGGGAGGAGDDGGPDGTSAGPAAPHPFSTTLVVLATDAALEVAEVSRTASCGHDGLARAIDPVHTLSDGDTVFALATGAVPLPTGAEHRRERVAALVAVQDAAARAVRAAVLDAVASARPVVLGDGTRVPTWGGDGG